MPEKHSATYFCRAHSKRVEKIIYCILWYATSLIFPWFSNFSFMIGSEGKLWRKKSILFIKNMATFIIIDAEVFMKKPNNAKQNACLIVPAELGSTSYSLNDSFSFSGNRRTEAPYKLKKHFKEKTGRDGCERFKANSNCTIKY